MSGETRSRSAGRPGPQQMVQNPSQYRPGPTCWGPGSSPTINHALGLGQMRLIWNLRDPRQLVEEAEVALSDQGAAAPNHNHSRIFSWYLL